MAYDVSGRLFLKLMGPDFERFLYSLYSPQALQLSLELQADVDGNGLPITSELARLAETHRQFLLAETFLHRPPFFETTSNFREQVRARLSAARRQIEDRVVRGMTEAEQSEFASLQTRAGANFHARYDEYPFNRFFNRQLPTPFSTMAEQPRKALLLKAHKLCSVQGAVKQPAVNPCYPT